MANWFHTPGASYNLDALARIEWIVGDSGSLHARLYSALTGRLSLVLRGQTARALADQVSYAYPFTVKHPITEDHP